MSDKTTTADILGFYNQVAKLKKLIRKGWELHGVPDPESVADHIFGVSLLALLYAKRFDLNVETAIIIAIIHEVGETVVGDITPNDGVAREEKSRLEENAACKLLSQVDPDGKLLELWKDFEYKRTKEGRLIKELDKLEMVLQAHNYEKETGIPLDEFFSFTESTLETDELLSALKQIYGSRRRNDKNS